MLRYLRTQLKGIAWIKEIFLCLSLKESFLSAKKKFYHLNNIVVTWKKYILTDDALTEMVLWFQELFFLCTHSCKIFIREKPMPWCLCFHNGYLFIFIPYDYKVNRTISNQSYFWTPISYWKSTAIHNIFNNIYCICVLGIL